MDSLKWHNAYRDGRKPGGYRYRSPQATLFYKRMRTVSSLTKLNRHMYSAHRQKFDISCAACLELAEQAALIFPSQPVTQQPADAVQ